MAERKSSEGNEEKGFESGDNSDDSRSSSAVSLNLLSEYSFDADKVWENIQGYSPTPSSSSRSSGLEIDIETDSDDIDVQQENEIDKKVKGLRELIKELINSKNGIAINTDDINDINTIVQKIKECFNTPYSSEYIYTLPDMFSYPGLKEAIKNQLLEDLDKLNKDYKKSTPWYTRLGRRILRKEGVDSQDILVLAKCFLLFDIPPHKVGSDSHFLKQFVKSISKLSTASDNEEMSTASDKDEDEIKEDKRYECKTAIDVMAYRTKCTEAFLVLMKANLFQREYKQVEAMVWEARADLINHPENDPNSNYAEKIKKIRGYVSSKPYLIDRFNQTGIIYNIGSMLPKNDIPRARRFYNWMDNNKTTKFLRIDKLFRFFRTKSSIENGWIDQQLEKGRVHKEVVNAVLDDGFFDDDSPRADNAAAVTSDHMIESGGQIENDDVSIENEQPRYAEELKRLAEKYGDCKLPIISDKTKDMRHGERGGLLFTKREKCEEAVRKQFEQARTVEKTPIEIVQSPFSGYGQPVPRRRDSSRVKSPPSPTTRGRDVTAATKGSSRRQSILCL